MKRGAPFLIIVVVAALLLPAVAVPQERGVEPGKLPDDFAFLRDIRAKLLAEIPRVEEELLELKRRRGEGEFLRQGLNRARRDLDAAKKETPVNQPRVRSIESYIADTEARLKELQASAVILEADTSKKEDERAKKLAQLTEVETKINNLLNAELPRQRFKQTVSVVFSGLVGIVIVGFFAIAFWDDKVRQTIFSGTAGIQFVTLFSVVIAIILFGITSILEGKELAALLGGLSGYILGRSTSETRTPPPTP